jgi:hypothetical protein
LAKSLTAIHKRTPKTAVTRIQNINNNGLFPKDEIPEIQKKKDEVKQPIGLKNTLKTTKYRLETQ